MTKKYTVIANSEGPHFTQIRKAIATVNGLQEYFKCQLVARNDILSAKAREIDSEDLGRKITKAFGDTPIIALTEEYYEYISEEKLPKHIFVTCDDWDAGDQPPLRLFLIYSLASALITLESKISAKKNEEMSHDPPVGCVFDWWTDARILRLDFVAARLCGQCREELSLHLDDPTEAIRATEKILEFVRRAVIGKETNFPTKVWIVHGHGDDWKELRQMLHELGIKEVAEFNEEPQEGKTIVSRWQEMASQARFAFALMTRDDRFEKQWRPRLNVAHEIGLCHARLGLESTAVLREKGVEIFSNIQGVVYLDYSPGKLCSKKRQIAALLKSRGVIV
jgi:hypothetical protein